MSGFGWLGPRRGNKHVQRPISLFEIKLCLWDSIGPGNLILRISRRLTTQSPRETPINTLFGQNFDLFPPKSFKKGLDILFIPPCRNPMASTVLTKVSTVSSGFLTNLCHCLLHCEGRMVGLALY